MNTSTEAICLLSFREISVLHTGHLCVRFTFVVWRVTFYVNYMFGKILELESSKRRWSRRKKPCNLGSSRTTAPRVCSIPCVHCIKGRAFIPRILTRHWCRQTTSAANSRNLGAVVRQSCHLCVTFEVWISYLEIFRYREFSGRLSSRLMPLAARSGSLTAIE